MLAECDIRNDGLLFAGFDVVEAGGMGIGCQPGRDGMPIVGPMAGCRVEDGGDVCSGLADGAD